MRSADAPSDSASRATLPPGQRIYAIGDIHGRLDLLDRLLDHIAIDAARAPTKAAITLVFLGDYVDRGPYSRQVVERLMQGPPTSGALAGAGWVCLMGNHEEVMLRFVSDLSVGAQWVRFGGAETVRSYGGPVPERPNQDLAGLQLALDRSLPPNHRRFLNRLPLSFRAGDYLFVHAGIRPGIPLELQAPADLLWIREDFLRHPATPLEVTVVHGHTPAATPQILPHRIGIDTGAYYTGNLTALVLEGSERRFLVS